MANYSLWIIKKMSNRILFFGNERLATGVTTVAPTLKSLKDAGYQIDAVVVAQSDLGKSRNRRAPEIVELAENLGIDVLAPKNLMQTMDQLASFGAEAGVLVAYGKIVPKAIIDIFPRGIINIHPSLLPAHRGPTPIESVILNGESKTGVSLMGLSADMDSGPIFAQRSLELSGSETKQQLADKLLAIGKDMLMENMPAILDGSLQPTSQSNEHVTYDKLIAKDMSQVKWDKPAEQLVREIRAYAYWPRSRTTLSGIDIIITGAHTQTGLGEPGKLVPQSKGLGVYTGNGVLEIDNLIPAGKKEMTAESFLAGYKLDL
jgi:methionyl-tRNA formyltransferase